MSHPLRTHCPFDRTPSAYTRYRCLYLHVRIDISPVTQYRQIEKKRNFSTYFADESRVSLIESIRPSIDTDGAMKSRHLFASLLQMLKGGSGCRRCGGDVGKSRTYISGSELPSSEEDPSKLLWLFSTCLA